MTTLLFRNFFFIKMGFVRYTIVKPNEHGKKNNPEPARKELFGHFSQNLPELPESSCIRRYLPEYPESR